MTTFYPRDIGMWRAYFDFNPDITLTPKEKYRYGVFKDRAALIEFMKSCGVRLDDPENPLKFEKYVGKHPLIPYPCDVFSVIQWTLVGWISEDYR